MTNLGMNQKKWVQELNENKLWNFTEVLCDKERDRLGWEVGGRLKKGIMYAYGWFILMYGRSQPNIIKQLSAN